MPFASPDIFRFAASEIQKRKVDVVIPSTEKGLEPLHSIYRRDTCLPLVTTALDAGKWKLITMFDQAKVHVIPPAEIIRFDKQGFAFWNLNTPEEFKTAEEQAKRMETNSL